MSSTGATTTTTYNDAFLPVSYTDESGTTTTYAYDSRYRLTSESSGGYTTTYAYNPDGTLASETTTENNESEAVNYSYDNNGRVVREQSGNDYTYYTYDTYGNVLINATFTPDEHYTDPIPALYDSTLTYTSEMVYTYDSNGRVATATDTVENEVSRYQYDSVSYTYDNTEYPVSSYTYDDEGIRTSATAWGNTLYYTTEDGRITSQYELDGNGDKQNEIVFIYNGDELLAALCNNNVYYYVKNAMGDVIALQDDAGNTLMEYRYNAWGDVTQKEISVLQDDAYFCSHNPFTYRSYYYDFEGFGAYYLQSRYYEDSFCRFLNADIPDIARQSKGETNGLNLFAYCCNDPVNNIDPTGYKKQSSKKTSSPYVTVRLYTIAKNTINIFGHIDVAFDGKVYSFGDWGRYRLKVIDEDENEKRQSKKRLIKSLRLKLSAKEYKSIQNFYNNNFIKPSNEEHHIPKKKTVLYRVNGFWGKYSLAYRTCATIVFYAFLYAMPFKIYAVTSYDIMLKGVSGFPLITFPYEVYKMIARMKVTFFM